MNETAKIKQKKPSITIYVLLLLAVVCFLFVFLEIYRSYHHPVINHITVSADKKADLSIQLLLIADLHDLQLGKGNRDLTNLIKKESPDLIIMAGDMIDEHSADSKNVISLINSLSNVAPVYYGLGNQELEYMKKKDKELCKELEAAGAIVLDKSFEDVMIRGQKLRIGGLYEYAFSTQEGDDPNPLFIKDGVDIFKKEFENTDNYKIMISHRPDSFIFGNASKIWDLDLVVSGHLHGGQVILPLFGGLWAGDQGFFPKYCHGLYHKDNIQLLITSGLGSHKETLPRFNNPPEIMIVEIH